MHFNTNQDFYTIGGIFTWIYQSKWVPLDIHYVRLMSLCGCVPQGKLTSQGKLLQQETFFVTEQDSGVLSRSKERRVFLFEQIVIFSELLRKGSSTPGYQFKKSIKVTTPLLVMVHGHCCYKPKVYFIFLCIQIFVHSHVPWGLFGGNTAYWWQKLNSFLKL